MIERLDVVALLLPDQPVANSTTAVQTWKKRKTLHNPKMSDFFLPQKSF